MALPITVNYPISSPILLVMPGSDSTVPSRVTSKGIESKTSPLDLKFQDCSWSSPLLSPRATILYLGGRRIELYILDAIYTGDQPPLKIASTSTISFCFQLPLEISLLRTVGFPTSSENGVHFQRRLESLLPQKCTFRDAQGHLQRPLGKTL